MSPPGRPKGEYRSAQHEGSPMRPRAVPRANTGVRSTKARDSGGMCGTAS
jgi:16S rRNA (guanine527-N7)-methyltransferase